MKKIVRMLISLVLIAATILLTVTPASALGSKKKYISEIKIAYANSVAEAKSELASAGYTVIPQNLNDNADIAASSYKAVYMGYKTTENPEEAITDIAMMSEECGYSFSDYQAMLNKQYSKYEILVDYEMSIIEEFRANYNAGKPLAINAYLSLNNYLEDDSGKLVGDYLLDTTLEKDDLFKFMTQISQYALYQFNVMLVSAISENSTDTFLTRLSQMTKDDINAAKADAALHESAMIIYDNLEAFRNMMRETEGTVSFRDSSEEAPELTEEEKKAAEEYYKENEAAVMSDVDTMSKAFVLLSLKNTKYGDLTLYDIVMNENISVTELYPLVKAMKPSQVASVKLSSIYDLFKTVGMNDSSKLTVADVNSAQGNNKTAVVSAYYGVDRSMFASTVAVTSDAAREMNSTGDKSPLWGNIASDDEIAMAFTMGIAAGVALVAFTAIAINAFYQAVILDQSFFFRYLGISLNPANLVSTYKSCILRNLPFTELYFVAAMQVIMYVAMAVVIVTSIVFLILELKNYYHPTYTTVPTILLDLRRENDADTYVRYDGVTTVSGKMGDLNGYVGRKWNAVYTTKDPTAGKPLLASALAFYTNSKDSETKYLGVHSFGQTSAVNLNNYTFNDETSIYLYFAKDTSYNMQTASVFSGAWLPIITGVSGLIIGAGISIFALAGKKKKTEAEA